MEKVDLQEVEQALGPDGSLAENLPDFRYRRQQLEMALEIAASINDGRPAVLEGGTGIGKSFAYLVPLLLGEAKALVSTSTKILQEQLIQKDIPVLARALGRAADARILKGRSNYICRHRLDESLKKSQLVDLFPDDKFAASDLKRVYEYVQTSSDGDKAGVRNVKDFSKVWPLVTSTNSNCLARKCPSFDDCFVYKARDEARGADLVIVNHALLLTDAALQEGKMLLADFDAVVFDEAHQLGEDIYRYFSTMVSIRALEAVLNEAIGFISSTRPEEGALIEAADSLFEKMERAREAFESRRQAMRAADVQADRQLSEATGALAGELGSFSELLESSFENSSLEATRLQNEFKLNSELLSAWSDQSEKYFCWVDCARKDPIFHLVPFDANERFKEHFFDSKSTVLTSATMSMDGSLDSFVEQLGIERQRSGIWDSPFNYQLNSMLFVPKGMPDPQKEDRKFVEAVATLAAELCKKSQGAALVLFSTWKNLKEGSSLLEEKLGPDFNVLTQGRGSKELLLHEFKSGRKNCLVGTRTFWQGIDMPGMTLKLVVIDKIPFIPPDDPLLQMEKEKIADERDAFGKLQVPKAILTLKQAAGRLIRTEDDKGLLVLCDPRVITKSHAYGDRIVNNLPGMKRTRDLEAAKKFLAGIK